MSRRPSARPVRGVIAVLAVVLTLVLGGCVRLPESGQVEVPPSDPTVDDGQDLDFVPSGPRAGAEPVEIVQRFLEAMRATAAQSSVARSFLTPEAAQSWAPEERTIVYDDLSRPSVGANVTVDLEGAGELDASGAWRGDLGGSRARLEFRLDLVDDEWRIADLPDAIVVPRSWFEQRYRQAALYFLDPSERVLVPEPIYVPTGASMAGRLIGGLLAGPPPGRDGVARTGLAGWEGAQASVEVLASGLADIQVEPPGRGDASPALDQLSEPAVAQLAWTLRQDPSVARFQVSVDGVALAMPLGGTEAEVSAGERYSPVVAGATPALYGLQDGRLVSVGGARPAPVDGPWGQSAAGIAEVAVNLSGTRVAGVSLAGEVRLTSVDERDADVVVVPARGALRPTWDFADRMWVVDQTDRARVQIVNQGSVDTVTVPGVTGQRVTRMIVSRDGSRLISVVGEGTRQRVVLNRVRYDERGGVLRVLGATVVHRIVESGVDRATRIADVGWRTPTELVVLTGIDDDRAVDLRRIPIDGSAEVLSRQAQLFAGSALRLATSPAPGSPLLLVGAESVLEETDGARAPFPEANGVSALTFAG